jgi:hypothetical protein
MQIAVSTFVLPRHSLKKFFEEESIIRSCFEEKYWKEEFWLVSL